MPFIQSGLLAMMALLLAPLLILSCSSNPRPRVAAPGMRGSADPCAEVNVPSEPPDTVPAWFQDDSSYSESPPHYLKHIIVVKFQPGTQAADRQSAINRVCGRVVGGWRSRSPDRGAYAVQVPDGGEEKRFDEFIEELRKLPHVRSATSTVRRWPQ